MILSRECLLASLTFWFTNAQKAFWQKALSWHSPCRQDCGSYWETLWVSCHGSEAEKPDLVWATLWGSLEDCRMRTSADTRIIVTLSCPIPLLLLFVFVKLVDFLTKAGVVTELCELLCSLSLCFFHNLLNAMKICFLCFLRNTIKSSIPQVWGRDYLDRVTEMSPPVYIAHLVLHIKGHLKVLESRIAGKSEVVFHFVLISGGGMRCRMLMEKNKKNYSLKRKK